MLPYGSGIPPSAPRTGQVAFTTSGAPTPALLRFSHHTVSFGIDSLALSLWCSDARNV